MQGKKAEGSDVGDRVDDPMDRLRVGYLERRPVRLRKESGNLVEKIGAHLEHGRRVDLKWK